MVRGALLTLAALALAGLLAAVTGILPMSAASGHWAPTQWLLDLSQRRAVATGALAVTVPPLDDPALALRGAGHYETACRRCHGVPGRETPVVLRNMLPRPPDLRYVAARYRPAELFHIVKHGLKFTGMPGWPALERDDEVWAMVAFLETLPALVPERYDEVVFGGTPAPAAAAASAAAAAPPAIVTAVCARCHGADGMGRRAGAFPVLAGQRPHYMYLSLRAFAYGGRLSGIMAPIAAGLDDQAMHAAAEYYGALPGLRMSQEPAGADEGPGRRIAMRGIAAQRVPSCAHCHGPGSTPRNEVYPTLTAQHPAYLDLQLRLFKGRQRGGTAFAHLMHPAADGLTADQRDAVVRYYGAAPGTPQIATRDPR